MTRKQLLFAPLILILAMLACNVPSAQGPASSNAAVGTITALAAALQAAQNTPAALPATAAAPATPTNTPLPSDTPTITLTPTETMTLTPTVPMVTVSQATNCRTGPGIVYDQVSSLSIGQSA